jgi:hypothetical protein
LNPSEGDNLFEFFKSHQDGLKMVVLKPLQIGPAKRYKIEKESLDD